MSVRILYLASTNPAKLREFRQAASAFAIEVRGLPEIERLPPCVEDGRTFEENSRKKALHYSAYTPEMVFADDSGIIVDALGGAPGVLSARFAGPGASDAANNRKLLDDLAKAGAADRAAHYVCVIALARQGEILAVVEGSVDGIITDQPRGSGGFGYDPYFFYPPLNRTFADLTPEAKFAVSHRGQAFRKLIHFLTSSTGSFR